MRTPFTQLTISTQFDSGAIEVLSLANPQDIQLNIRADQGVSGAAEFAQWFHFRLQGAAGVPLKLRFLNAGQCAYPKGWDGYCVVASYDRQLWFRIDTAFDALSDNKVMTATITPALIATSTAFQRSSPGGLNIAIGWRFDTCVLNILGDLRK